MNNFKTINSNPLISLIQESLLSLPTPVSISFLWNLGFLTGITLIVQITTGVLLSINYVPSVAEAYESVIHIIRDIDSGWVVRYIHINTASLMFITMYAHLARGVYFNAPSNQPLVWGSGLLILLTCMATAFIGYVLPWGQISYWGATVITSIISAVPYLGSSVTLWVWGGFSISQPTLNRFFSIHFLLPIIILTLVVFHLIFLHTNGSSNPTGTNPDIDNTNFFPYFLVNDLTPIVTLIIIIAALISTAPNILGDVENFNIVSETTTPVHIQPEWYFLFAYTILRAVPSNLGGVVAIILAVTITLVLTLNNNSNNSNFSPLNNITFFSWVGSVILLTWLGSNPVEEPFTLLSNVISILYFSLSVLL